MNIWNLLQGEDKTAIKEIEKEIFPTDNEWFSNSPAAMEKRQILAETIYDAAIWEVELKNPLNMIFGDISGDYGEVYHRKYTGYARTETRAIGGVKKPSKPNIYYRSFSSYTQTCALDLPFEQIGPNRPYDLSGLVNAVANGMLLGRYDAVWTAFLAACGAGTAQYTASAGGVLLQASVDAALQRLLDYGSGVMIWARNSVLFPMAQWGGYDTLSGYPETVKETLHNMGMLNQYRGALVLGEMFKQDPKYGTTALDAANVMFIPTDEGSKEWNVKYVRKNETVVQETDVKTNKWFYAIDYDENYIFNTDLNANIHLHRVEITA